MIQQNIFTQSLPKGATIADQLAAEALSIVDVLKGTEESTNEDLCCAVAVFLLDVMRQKAINDHDPNSVDWLVQQMTSRCEAVGGRTLFFTGSTCHVGWQTSLNASGSYVCFSIANTRVTLRAGVPSAPYFERHMPLRSISTWRPLMLRALRGCVRIEDPGAAMGYARQLLWEKAESELALFLLRNQNVGGLLDYINSHWPGEAPVDQILEVPV